MTRMVGVRFSVVGDPGQVSHASVADLSELKWTGGTWPFRDPREAALE